MHLEIAAKPQVWKQKDIQKVWGDWSRIEKESFFLIALAQYIDPYMKMHP
jgi:hypothetical protein